MLTFVTFDATLKQLVLIPRTEEENAAHYETFVKNNQSETIVRIVEDIVFVIRPEIYQILIDEILKRFMRIVLDNVKNIQQNIQRHGKHEIEKDELLKIHSLFSNVDPTDAYDRKMLSLNDMLEYIEEKKLGKLIKKQSEYSLEIRTTNIIRSVEYNIHNSFKDLFSK